MPDISSSVVLSGLITDGLAFMGQWVTVLTPIFTLVLGLMAAWFVGGKIISLARLQMGLDVVVPFNDGQEVTVPLSMITSEQHNAVRAALSRKIKDETFLDWDAD